MTERKDTIKLANDELGIEVEWKRVTYGERRELIRRMREADDIEKEIRAAIVAHVVKWNIDKPVKEATLDDLYTEEVDWLYGLITRVINNTLTVTAEDIKN